MSRFGPLAKTLVGACGAADCLRRPGDASCKRGAGRADKTDGLVCDPSDGVGGPSGGGLEAAPHGDDGGTDAGDRHLVAGWAATMHYQAADLVAGIISAAGQSNVVPLLKAVDSR